MSNPSSAVTLIEPQRLKLWLWAAVLAASGICMFAHDYLACLTGMDSASFTLCGVALGLVALLGVSLSIRCPSCGLSLAWYALSKQSHSAWLSWLLDIETCPRCGYSHALVRK